MKIILILSVVFLAINFHCIGQTNSSYKIHQKIAVEGNGGWDYVAIDENTGRLFISHSSVTQVVDSKTGKLLGTIENTNGVHGIALDNEDNKAFISCGRDSTVTIVNLKTLKFIAKIKVTGANPDAILYDKFSGNVFTFNGRSSNSTVINAQTNKVIATIPLAGKPEFSVSDGNGKVFVNIEDKSLLTVINSKTLKVENQWSLNPGQEPSGLAFDPKTNTLFSVCDNNLMVIMNATNGKIISTLPIGSHVDGCTFDTVLKRAYSSNGDGTITVVQQNKNGLYNVLENIKTPKGARTICVNNKTHHLYLPTANYGPAPEPTKERPHPWPTILPGTFKILDVMPN